MQPNGRRRLRGVLLLDRPLVPFEAVELGLKPVRQNAGFHRRDQSVNLLVDPGQKCL